MDKDIFFAQFGHLAQGPGGIKKLRDLILQLAVQGKLVEQDADDEPASVLLEKMIKAKKALIAEKKHKKLSKLPKLTGDECSGSIPDTWRWVRLGEITNYGETLKAEPSDLDNDDVWVLELEDIEKNSSRLLKRVSFAERRFRSSKNRFSVGDVLYGKLRPYLDKVIVAGESGVCTTEVIPIRGYFGLEPEYLRWALKAPSFIQYANNSTHGMNLPRMGTDKARLAVIPLAPLAEQKRIVAKVDELMAVCDELEARQNEHVALKRDCVASTLHHLTAAAGPDEINTNWSITQNNFHYWFNDPQTVKTLRATILQLAVQGKLVPQDPEDEPASVLLQKVADEKEKLIEAKVIKKQKPLPEINLRDEPCNLPRDWKWVRFGDLFMSSEYGTSEKAMATESSGVPVYAMGHIQNRELRDGNFKYLKYQSDSLPKLYLKHKDLLFNRTNSYELVGKTAIYWGNDDERTFASYLIRVALFHDHVDCVYANIYLNSPLCRKTQIEPEITKQTNQANFNGTKLKHIVFPLPPLAEQLRIVAKVDELMTLCDQLEAQIDAQSQLTQDLTASLIHHMTAA